MTIGVGTYSPGERFAFPRSYIAGVVNHSAGFTLTQALNIFTLDFHPTYTSVYTWVFSPDFWFWSSNCYTLDHVVEECYYRDNPGDPPIPLNFGLRWSRSTPPHHPILLFAPNNNFSNSVPAIFTSIVPGYWTQPT
jgi:hypothetical protein